MLYQGLLEEVLPYRREQTKTEYCRVLATWLISSDVFLTRKETALTVAVECSMFLRVLFVCVEVPRPLPPRIMAPMKTA